jgi:DNA-directed RNA polymerase specialized sigma24 family protein
VHLSVKEIKKLLKNYCFFKSSISSVESRSALKEKLDLVSNALTAMDDESRRAIEMVYFERQPIENVARQFQIAPSTVYYRIDMAIKRIGYLTE